LSIFVNQSNWFLDVRPFFVPLWLCARYIGAAFGFGGAACSCAVLGPTPSPSRVQARNFGAAVPRARPTGRNLSPTSPRPHKRLRLRILSRKGRGFGLSWLFPTSASNNARCSSRRPLPHPPACLRRQSRRLSRRLRGLDR
jgi:hypothetical protein